MEELKKALQEEFKFKDIDIKIVNNLHSLDVALRIKSMFYVDLNILFDIIKEYYIFDIVKIDNANYETVTFKFIDY